MAPETARVLPFRKAAARTADEREFLSAALEIVETPVSPAGRAIGGVIILAVAIAVIWACVGKVDIIATAPGKIVPVGKTKIVQPMETSVISAIHVTDGAHVREGDTLVELDAIQTVADRDHFARDLRQARLDVARLEGLAANLKGQPLRLVDPPEDASRRSWNWRAGQLAQAADEQAKLLGLDQQVAEKQSEAAEASATIDKLSASLPMVADEEQIRRQLYAMQFGNKLAWYEANEKLIEQQHDILVQARHKEGAEASAKALQQQRDATAAEYLVTLLQDLDKAQAQANQNRADLAKAEDRLRLEVLRAPIDGTVQQVAIHTIGGVVTPAEQLMAIVPDKDGLIVEATVENKDVGFVHVGQTARVKIDTFNFTRYGLIDGKVIGLSRDTVEGEDGRQQRQGDDKDGDGTKQSQEPREPSYVARIALSRDWMLTEGGKVALGPGMAVTAEIQTGRRRIISYLLSPLVRHVEESGHER